MTDEKSLRKKEIDINEEQVRNLEDFIRNPVCKKNELDITSKNVDGRVKLSFFAKTEKETEEAVTKKKEEYYSPIDNSIGCNFFVNTTYESVNLQKCEKKTHINKTQHLGAEDKNLLQKPTICPREISINTDQIQIEEIDIPTNSNKKEEQSLREMTLVFNDMREVIRSLADAMVKMTKGGLTKPMAGAETTEEQRSSEKQKRTCFECQSLTHLVKDCPTRRRKRKMNKVWMKEINKNQIIRGKGTSPTGFITGTTYTQDFSCSRRPCMQRNNFPLQMQANFEGSIRGNFRRNTRGRSGLPTNHRSYNSQEYKRLNQEHRSKTM